MSSFTSTKRGNKIIIFPYLAFSLFSSKRSFKDKVIYFECSMASMGSIVVPQLQFAFAFTIFPPTRGVTTETGKIELELLSQICQIDMFCVRMSVCRKIFSQFI